MDVRRCCRHAAGLCEDSGDSPKADVLASVPGTPQAQEGLIANSIPQTATITRSEAKLTVVYDGAADLRAHRRHIDVLCEEYVGAGHQAQRYSYYCVEAGVWFKASTPQGPVDASLTPCPDEIYTIPPSSPIYYVTYVKVYNSTPEVVYVGYTPGYYGTVVSASTTTVVYGTGWYYAPYISPTVWYGWPYTYGVGARLHLVGHPRAGASASVTATLTTPGITRGGDRWVITDTAGIRITDGAPGEEPRSPTSMACGAIPLTRARRQRGQILTPATTERPPAARTTTRRPGAAPLQAAATTRTSTPATPPAIAEAQPTIPNTGIVAGGGAGYAGNIYSGQGTAGRGGFAYNTNTNAGVAAGKNNVYAGKDGTVYRYNRQSGDWSSNSGSGWQSTTQARCQSATPAADAQPGCATLADLQLDARQLRREDGRRWRHAWRWRTSPIIGLSTFEFGPRDCRVATRINSPDSEAIRVSVRHGVRRYRRLRETRSR